jgi:hypothetical protein
MKIEFVGGPKDGKLLVLSYQVSEWVFAVDDGVPHPIHAETRGDPSQLIQRSVVRYEHSGKADVYPLPQGGWDIVHLFEVA